MYFSILLVYFPRRVLYGPELPFCFGHPSETIHLPRKAIVFAGIVHAPPSMVVITNQESPN